jgi:hypothetical protein
MLHGMKKRVLIVGFVCVSVLAAAHLSAQQTAEVTIRVTDPSGAAIGHAQVQLSRLVTKFPSETDADGDVVFTLEAGTYDLSVSAAGFKSASQQVELGPADRSPAPARTIPIVLKVGDVGGGMVVYPADSLILTDDLHASATFSDADFHTLKQISITVHNSHTGSDETYSGVPLSTLLAKINAPMGNELRGKAMTNFLIATGSDGYAVVLSLAEADPEFHESQVIVADARDGQPLGKNGPFQLIVPGDKRPARWVHNLVSITLKHSD